MSENIIDRWKANASNPKSSSLPTHRIFNKLNWLENNKQNNKHQNALFYNALQAELESRDPYLETEQYIGQSDDNEPIFAPIEYDEVIYYDENGEPL